MINPFEELGQKLDILIQRVSDLEKKSEAPRPGRIPLKQFCQEYHITRVTAYAWSERQLIELEKVAGRQYVKTNSISVTRKFQRDPVLV